MRAILKILFVLAFVGALGYMAVYTVREPDGFNVLENRYPAPRPDWPDSWQALVAFPEAFEAYWNDSLHQRQKIIKLFTVTRYHLGISPQKYITVGKEGWLFFNDEGAMEAYRNNRPFTPDEVNRWRNYLLYRHMYAEQIGAKYYFFVAPNAQTIYPEYMPDNVTRINPDSWMDQIIQSVEGTGVRVIDLRPALLASKHMGQLYLPLDTHWSLIGSNVSQHAVLSEIQKDFPELQPVLYPPERFEMADVNEFPEEGLEFAYSLAVMLGMNEELYQKEPIIRGLPRDCAQPAELELEPWKDLPEGPKNQTFNAWQCDKAPYKVVFYRDSFANWLNPYWKNSFGFMANIWTYRPSDTFIWSYIVDQVQPDFIMDEIVERYLERVPEPGHGYPADFDPETFRIPEKTQ